MIHFDRTSNYSREVQAEFEQRHGLTYETDFSFEPGARVTPGYNYQTQHAYLRTIFGKASEHHCVGRGCPNQAQHWSLEDVTEDSRWDDKVGLWWSENVGDYAPRCPGCHGIVTVAQRLEMARMDMLLSPSLRRQHRRRQ